MAKIFFWILILATITCSALAFKNPGQTAYQYATVLFVQLDLLIGYTTYRE